MKSGDLRGVNLGGWLVLERWITPSLFQGVTGPDEHALTTELSPLESRRRIEKHRKTFIKREHLLKIKNMGLNAVRVPVGYWVFDDVDGFIGGASTYLDSLFQWAAELELEVLICLHGAPGSQNGYDHSGWSGTIGWNSSQANITQTIGVIQRLVQRYGQHSNLFGIELLNEPHYTMPLRDLMRYYRKAARTVRRGASKDVRWVVSDGFRPRQMTRRLMLRWFHRPILDQHMYQLYTPEERRLDLAGHIAKANEWHPELKRRNCWLPVIVGEWSAAMDEMYQPELASSARHYTAADYFRYATAQKDAFESAGCGWFYWTARTEDQGIWSLLDHPELLGKS